MTLHKILTDNREEILLKCRGKIHDVSNSPDETKKFESGLETLYQEVVEVLAKSNEDDSQQTRDRVVDQAVNVESGKLHGRRSFRMGYTISQVVHSYGAICQGITEYAHDADASITAAEFSQLNLCLDAAIANAVTEFEALGTKGTEWTERLSMGYLVHEVRNALSNAMMAHELIQTGQVGTTGATSSMLTKSLIKMKDIIDRAMAEVRLGSEPDVVFTPVLLQSLLGELEVSGRYEASQKTTVLQVDVTPDLEVNADRHLLSSALSNIIQNAIKYSPSGSTVRINAYSAGPSAVIEIQDECGGLPPGKVEEMFKPYAQGSGDRSGLGLGISIANRAVILNKGTLTVRDVPGSGCVFTVTLPLRIADTPSPVV